jgi:hypothetical protein
MVLGFGPPWRALRLPGEAGDAGPSRLRQAWDPCEPGRGPCELRAARVEDRMATFAQVGMVLTDAVDQIGLGASQQGVNPRWRQLWDYPYSQSSKGDIKWLSHWRR